MSILKNKRTKYILLTILIVAAVSGIYGYKEYNRTQKDIASIKPAYTLSSKSVIDEFSKNDSLATAKYLGKPIAINGNIKSIEKDENGFFTLVLGDSTSSTSIRCSMDSVHNTEANTVKEGNAIKVQGICTGFNNDEMGLGADIIFNHSCIIKEK